MSDYYIKMSELIELAKDKDILDPALNRGDESFVKGAEWGVETLTILADANLQHYDIDKGELDITKCPYCGGDMLPRVTSITGNNRVLTALCCEVCGSITPEILFTSSLIDRDKLVKEMETRVKAAKRDRENI